MKFELFFRAVSSFGRAPPLHGGGGEFDPPTVHHPALVKFCSCIYYILGISHRTPEQTTILLLALILVATITRPIYADNLTGGRWLKERIDRVYIVKPVNDWVPWGRLIAVAYWLPFKSLQSANNHITDWDHLKDATIFIPKWQIPTDHVKKWQRWLAQFHDPKYQTWLAAMVGAIRRQPTQPVRDFLPADRQPKAHFYHQLTSNRRYDSDSSPKPSLDLIAIIVLTLILVVSIVYLLVYAYRPWVRSVRVDQNLKPRYEIHYFKSTNNFAAIDLYPHRPRNISSQVTPSLEELELDPY